MLVKNLILVVTIYYNLGVACLITLSLILQIINLGIQREKCENLLFNSSISTVTSFDREKLGKGIKCLKAYIGDEKYINLVKKHKSEEKIIYNPTLFDVKDMVDSMTGIEYIHDFFNEAYWSKFDILFLIHFLTLLILWVLTEFFLWEYHKNEHAITFSHHYKYFSKVRISKGIKFFRRLKSSKESFTLIIYSDHRLEYFTFSMYLDD